MRRVEITGQDGRILEELIYDQVRKNVNLCQLVIIEQELDDSIERALGSSDKANSECGHERGQVPHSELAGRYLRRAWRRLEQEWQRLRAELGCGAEKDPDGPCRRDSA